MFFSELCSGGCAQIIIVVVFERALFAVGCVLAFIAPQQGVGS